MFDTRLYLDDVRKFKDLLLEASSVQVHVQRPVHALLDVRMTRTFLIMVKITFLKNGVDFCQPLGYMEFLSLLTSPKI